MRMDGPPDPVVGRSLRMILRTSSDASEREVRGRCGGGAGEGRGRGDARLTLLRADAPCDAWRTTLHFRPLK